MIDIANLKQHLIDSPELIGKILDECGFGNIHEVSEGYRCGWDEDSAGNSIIVNSDNLHCTSFSRNIKGDIIVLVQSKLSLNLPKALSKIATIADYDGADKKEVSKIEVFGGMFSKFKKKKQESEIITTYDDSVLEQYLRMPNERFIKDGIGAYTQMTYEIMYDPMSNRIVIVWRDVLGKVVGAMGRLNKTELDDYDIKYLPLIPFKKKQTLYGINQNYQFIAQNGVAVVGEAEKFVMQSHSFGITNAVSVGGSTISETHKNIIHSAMPNKILLAFDEGIEEEKLVYEAEKLKAVNPFMDSTEVYYIYDKNGDVLKRGTKNSPSDLGREGMMELMKNHMRKV